MCQSGSQKFRKRERRGLALLLSGEAEVHVLLRVQHGVSKRLKVPDLRHLRPNWRQIR